VSTAELAAPIAQPLRLTRWLSVAALIAAGFFALVLAIALTISVAASHPIEGPPFLVGNLANALSIFSRNFLVLTLYAMVGVGVIVVRRAASHGHHGAVRACTVLLALIVAASIARQAYVLGRMLAEYSAYLGDDPLRMGLGLVPHAAIELTAMFLPLGAIIVERRSGEAASRQALAVAVAVAIPLLMLAAASEVYVSPSVMRAVTCTRAGALGPAGERCAVEELARTR
jgi:hypothetical protein